MNNISRLTQQHIRDSKRYEKFARVVFYKALRTMVMPIIERGGHGEVSHFPLLMAYYKVYIYAGVEGAKNEYKRLRKQEPTKDLGLDLLVNTWTSWMRNYVAKNLAKRITEVSTNTQKAINVSLQDGLAAGDTLEQIKNRIYENTLGIIGRNRAALIANTETTAAVNIGKRKSADDWSQSQGVELYKKWLHTPRPTERTSHEDEADKPPIAADQPFQVYNTQTGGIDYMMQPGDLSAPAAQNCNCNCTVVYMSRRFAENNFSLY